MKRKQMYTYLLVIAMLAQGCSLAPREEELPEAPVIPTSTIAEYKKAEVLRGDIVESLVTKCTYTAFHTEGYKFPVDGIRIEHVYIEEGDFVKKGDLLADLDMDQTNQQIEELEDNIELLQMRISNEKELKEFTRKNQEKLSALEGYNMQLDQEFNLTVDAHDNAIKGLEDELYIKRKRLELLQEDAKSRQMIAGMDGIVSYVASFREGDSSNSATDFIKLYDPESMVFVTDGKNSEQFVIGEKVTIDVSGVEYPATVITATELSLGEIKDAEAGKQLLRAEDPNKRLQSGEEGKITILLNEITDTLYLPSSAVHSENSKSFVYVEDEGGFKSLKEVEVGIIADKKVEVKSGLNEGDSVIID